MQSLMVEVTDNEKIAIGNELEKLFAAHDRPLSTAKKAFLVQELVGSGIPVKALTAGIRKLVHEDLKSIRLITLIDAAHEFLADVVLAPVPCDFCFGSGVVLALDQSKYRFALACICPNGSRRMESQHLVRWAGTETQMSRGRILVIDSGLAIA